MEVNGFLLFHTLAELSAVVVSACIFVLAWNSRDVIQNRYLLFVGIAYLAVGAIDLVHTMAYTGMGVFPNAPGNLPTQLWIAGRYVESLSLLGGLFLASRVARPGALFAFYVLVVAVLLAAIFGGYFPTCFVDGAGLTTFKKVSEYVISTVLLVSLILLWRRKEAFDPRVLRLLGLSIGLTICSELAFTLYVSLFDLSNIVGHLFKVASFALVYVAVVQTGLREPARLLFRDLHESRRALQLGNEALERERRSLQQANQELESFSATAAHDLNNPLTIILSQSDLLTATGLQGSEPALLDGLKDIGEAAERMSGIIQGLGELGRLRTAGLKRESLDLGEVAGEVAERLARSKEGRLVEFVSATGAVVEADRGLMERVFENLLGNAWKYNRGRGDLRVEFGVSSGPDGVTYFVRDNGIGFPTERTGELFRPFTRMHQELGFEGTGIGLASVERAIARHGGRVWAESPPGEGATFFFTLPAAQP